MKFLRNKQLKHLGAFVIVITLFVLIAQYFIINAKEEKLEEAENKIEFTQIAQLNNQKISLMMQNFLNSNKGIAPEIAAQVTTQDRYLKILSEGGLMEQRNAFIKPLTLLPAITFHSLKEDWETYKQSIYSLITENEKASVSPDSANLDVIVPVVVSSSGQSAKIKFEGLSITMSSWYDRLVQDLDEEVDAKRTSLATTKFIILIFNISLFGGFYFLFNIYVLKPLRVLYSNTKEHTHTLNFPENEIGMVASVINETVENLKDATEFVAAIGQGNLNMNYKESLDKNYTVGNNKLADSLIEMQTKLRQLNEEEQKRQWANEGLARFVEILRSSNDNLVILGDKIISGLINYTHSNQGALYILNDEEDANIHLELVSLYAFDIKKYEQQKVKPGQGILGQTFLEKQTTYLTSLPDEYIKITSGLGGANPKCVLIVPLKVDQEVYGLVELASFNEYQPHEIDFVEKLGETLASTLGSVKAAQRNRHLIEQFQQQTEQMRAQEEEMRQNMEELQATQEEIVRKEKSYISTIQELEETLKTRIGINEVDKLKATYQALENQYQQELKKLEQQLAEKTTKSDDWGIADELNKTLRINLQALQLTQEELKRKQKV